MEMDESASGGRMSTSAVECRCSATDEEGLTFDGRTTWRIPGR